MYMARVEQYAALRSIAGKRVVEEERWWWMVHNKRGDSHSLREQALTIRASAGSWGPWLLAFLPCAAGVGNVLVPYLATGWLDGRANNASHLTMACRSRTAQPRATQAYTPFVHDS